MNDTKQKKAKIYLNIPIRLELRNRLKAQAALSGKSLYDYCTDILEKALQNRNDEGDKK